MKLTMQTVQQYLVACESQKRLNPKTLKAYRIDLRQFVEYVSAEEMDFDREAVKAYFDSGA